MRLQHYTVCMAISNLITWLLWFNSYIVVQVSFVRSEIKLLTGNVKKAIQTLYEIPFQSCAPFYLHTRIFNYLAFFEISHPNYSGDPSSVLLFFRILLRFGLHEKVGGCKYSDCFRKGLIEASVMGTFLTMNMRIVRNQWFLCWLIHFVSLCWAFTQ